MASKKTDEVNGYDLSDNIKYLYLPPPSKELDEYVSKLPYKWRVKNPSVTRPGEAVQQPPLERSQILEPLDHVFIEDSLMDEIIIRLSIPDLLDGKEPSYGGVILFGPPGTGKSELQRAVIEVYRRAGAYARDESASRLNSAFVGQFAINLEDVINEAIGEAKRRNKHSFVSFDEGSSIVQQALYGSNSVGKHYQETIDVLKRYVGNSKEFVIAISTNTLHESFEEALTREGRLTAFFIPYPEKEQIKRMWNHFLGKYDVMKDMEDEQLERLASMTEGHSGAFVDEFCKTYERRRRHDILKEMGFTSLREAMKKGVAISDEIVKASITYDRLLSDLTFYLEAKEKRAAKYNHNKGKLGF